MKQEYAFLAGLLLCSFVVQVLPRVRVREFGIDSWRWLLWAREIRRARFRLPRYIDRYIFKARYSYPPLFHFFLALLPERVREKWDFVISPSFAVFEAALLYAFVSHLTSDTSAAIVATAVYVTTAANIIENNNLNTRSFGQLTFSLALAALYFQVFEGASCAYFVVACAVVLLGHRMSSQLLLFVSVFISVTLGRLDIIGEFFLAIPVALVLSAGRYFYVIYGHLRQIRFWFRMLVRDREKIKLNPKIFVTSILSRNLHIIAATAIAIMLPTMSALDHAAIGLTLFLLATAILTTFIIELRCIGEGYRYVGYATPIVAIFMGTHFRTAPVIVIVSCFVSLMPAIVKQIRLATGRLNPAYSFRISDELATQLKRLFGATDHELRFMSYPPNYDDYVAFRHPNARVFFHDNGLVADKCYDPFYGTYPPAVELESKLLTHRIDIFLCAGDFEFKSYIRIPVPHSNLYVNEVHRDLAGC